MERAVAKSMPLAATSLDDVVAHLGDRVAPISLARERTLPVAEPLDSLFPEGGLVRGRVLSCRGGAASSIAFATLREAAVEGAWVAAIDVPTFGPDAAAEFGVPLDRVVRIETGATSADGHPPHGATWVDVMGAVADGFDLILARVPAALLGDRRPAAVRKLRSRLQQRGAVVVVLGETGALPCDITLDTARTVWSGLGQGWGRLRRRSIDVEATGRRLPGRRTCTLELVGAPSGVEISPSPSAQPAVSDDPQAEVLAEMCAAGDLEAAPLAEMCAAGDLEAAPLAAG